MDKKYQKVEIDGYEYWANKHRCEGCIYLRPFGCYEPDEGGHWAACHYSQVHQYVKDVNSTPCPYYTTEGSYFELAKTTFRKF